MHEKDIRMFCFEVIDTGIGMIPKDLQKFGLYLASLILKQTRSSQGFGVPNAFTDSQNMTERPITVITRHHNLPNATLSVFYTTNKNQKEYSLDPESFETSMQHGTYIKLYYLSVKYIRGCVDEYIKQASYLNGHITLIFIDPYGDVHIYPRKVDIFPNEPKYAQPHPASVLISEFRELLRSTNKKDIVTFLSSSFVRMSRKHAKEIVEKANSILGAAQNLLTISPSELSETNIRALYRNLTGAVVCFNKTSPENILKFIQDFDNKPIIKVFPHFYDYSKEKLIPILKNLEIENKKSSEITLEDIKNIQMGYKDVNYCPFSISFARFNSFLKESPDTIEKILSKRFCNLNSNTIKKLILKTEELLKIRNLYVLNTEELTKKELKVLYEAITKNIGDFELSFNKLDSLLKESKGKSLITTLKKLKGIGAKTLETILEECNAQLEYKNLANIPANKLTTKAQKVLFVEMNSLKKCPSSITLNKFSEMLKNSKNKNLSFFISQNFAVLSKKEIDEIIIVTNESLGGAKSLESIKPSELNEEQMNILFRIFSSEKYLAPPTDTVVPVGSGNLIKIIDMCLEPEFVVAETRRPTSSKGLAFGVEVAIAYGGKIKVVSNEKEILYRYINRSPILLEPAECIIWKTFSSVYRNNEIHYDSYYYPEIIKLYFTKGKIRFFINISGPFIQRILNKQIRKALVNDKILVNEIKLGLVEAGRKLLKLQRKKERTIQLIKLKKEKELEEKVIKELKNQFNITEKNISVNQKGFVNFLSLCHKSLNYVPENINKFSHLNSLDLSFNHITKIENLNGIKKLKKLDLSNNKIIKIEGLDNLLKLQELNLSHNQITEIQGLENLKLKYLNLSYNQISKIKGLNRQSKLIELNLSVNEIIELEGLEDLSNLEILWLEISKWDKELLDLNPYDVKSAVNYCKKLKRKRSKIKTRKSKKRLKRL